MIELPAFVAGPENQGRGYRVLAQSGAPAEGSWTIDLPLMLFEWAKLERSEPFVACIPVGSAGMIVCRGRFFRRLAIGHVCYLHGVSVSLGAAEALDWRTERVAAMIPDPDETLNFALAPVQLAPLPPVAPIDWPGLGLAWRNRVISVEPPMVPEEILYKALASVSPAVQRRRITGWASTVELPSRGTVNPVPRSQLLVTSGAAPSIAGFMPVTVRADRSVAGDMVALPEGRVMWQRLHDALADLPAMPADPPQLRWQIDMADQSAEAVAVHLLRAAAAVLPSERALGFLEGVITRGEPDLRAPGSAVLDAFVTALPDGDRGATAAGLVARLAATPDNGALAAVLIHHVDAAGLAAAPAATLTRLLDFAIGQLRVPDYILERRHLAPLADIATAFAARCQDGSVSFDPLGRLIELWPAEFADMLDGVMTVDLVRTIRQRGRTALTAVSQKMVKSIKLQFRTRPATRGEALRLLAVLITTIRLIEE